MQLLIDFLPIAIFVATYFLSGSMYWAIGAIMIAAPLAFLVQWFMTRQISKLAAGSTALVVILGGASLAFENKMFFLWKPTAFYWVAAVVFLGSQFIGDRPIIQRLMQAASKQGDQSIVMPAAKWLTLNLAWVVFFVIAGALNIYVAYNYSEPTWVKFKLFGLIGLTLVFVIAQSFWLARHIDPESQ